MKKIILLISILFSTSLFAAEKFPNQCRISGIRFSKESVSLFSQHTAKPRLYAIENTGKKAIWLTHNAKNPSASAGWASQLMPNHWSAILVTQKTFDLSCQLQSRSGKMKTVSCKQLLHVCQFSDFTSKRPINGGYWVVENVLFSALEPRMKTRGFSLNSLDQRT